MWWSLFIILLVGLVALSQSDLEHTSMLHAFVAPLVTLGALFAFALWVILLLLRLGVRRDRAGRRFDVGTSADTDGGGDGGD